MSDAPVEEKLPLLVEDITVEWLSSKLGRPITSFRQRDVVHQTASKLFISVTFEGEEKEHPLCIKAGFNPVIRELYPFLVGIYVREVNFLNRIAPSVKHMEIAKCWWAGYNSTQGIVIMDDLAESGCKFGDPTQTWTVDQVLAGVEQLAGLHSGTWGAQHADYPWLESDFIQYLLTLLRSGYETFTAQPDRPIPADMKDKARMEAVMEKYIRLRNPRFQALLHGDTHIGNTYFTAAGAPRFLDWQLIYIGSAFHDVAYFMAGALTIEDRRAHEKRILDHYLATLASFGGPKLDSSDEEVWLEYRKSLLSGVAWFVTPYEMQTPERVHALCARYGAAVQDHGVVELVESLPERS